jgi:DNA-binding phage protein
MNKKHDPLYYVKKINEYLDNALNENESTDFIKSVQQDPSLNQMLNKERNLRTMLKNQLKRQTVDNSFINSLKQRLY